MDEETKYKEELLKNGVDLPELKAEEKKEEAPAPEVKKEEPKEPEPLQEEPKEQRKRSIYDDFKENKRELKSERELREQAERERDDLARQVANFNQQGTEDEEPEDEFTAFARKTNADPEAVRELVALARKGNQIDPALQKDLQEFKKWKSQNAGVLESQMFAEEFAKTLPSLKEMFPTVDENELSSLRKEIDVISHKTEWHDKDLDYVVFKNKDHLSQFVSPKKKGMETKGRADVDVSTFEFDGNADLSKMSSEERSKWEAEYHKAGKANEIRTEGGKRILL